MRAQVARAPIRLNSSTLAWGALAVLLITAGALLFRLTRDTTLWRDELLWALGRRGNSLGTFLEPNYEHFSLVPVAIYKLLFATAGLDDYRPYRVLVIGAHLGCVALLFVYANRRVGPFLGLLAAALLLFFGPAAQNFIWPFQMAWLISLGAGVGALLMLDRDDRLGDITASALLAVSLASSGLGLPIALGLAADVLWGRRCWRNIWIVAAPLAAYAVWWLVYAESQTEHWSQDIYLTPGWVFSAPADAISALLGLAGPTRIDGPETPLVWGAPLGIAAVAVLIWRLTRLRTVPPRVLTLLTIGLSFWILTALNRAFFGGPWGGRYLYVGGLVILLLAVELARGISLSRRAELMLAAVTAAAVVSNIGALRDASAWLRDNALDTRTQLGALDIARPILRPEYVPTGFFYSEITAGPYFAAKDEFGTPAASPAEIAAAPERFRLAVDAQLIRIHEIDLVEATQSTRAGSAPRVESVTGGVARRRGPCVSFRPAAFTPATAANELHVEVPPQGLLLSARGGQATVSLRRFADGYPERPLGTLAPSAGAAALRIRPDLAEQPWHLRVAPAGSATVCSLE
jgi:hypothetical protein